MLPATIPPQTLDRKALLRLRRRTLKEFADQFGVSLGHVSRVVSGERRGSRELERAIARALGVTREAAFPEWYEGAERTA